MQIYRRNNWTGLAAALPTRWGALLSASFGVTPPVSARHAAKCPHRHALGVWTPLLSGATCGDELAHGVPSCGNCRTNAPSNIPLSAPSNIPSSVPSAGESSRVAGLRVLNCKLSEMGMADAFSQEQRQLCLDATGGEAKIAARMLLDSEQDGGPSCPMIVD